MKHARSRIIISRDYVGDDSFMELKIYVYSGELVADQPNEPLYEFVKERASSEIETEYFNVAEYVKSEIGVNVPKWLAIEIKSESEPVFTEQTFLFNNSYHRDTTPYKNVCLEPDVVRYISKDANIPFRYLKNNDGQYDELVSNTSNIDITPASNSISVDGLYFIQENDFNSRGVATIYLKKNGYIVYTYIYKKVDEKIYEPVYVDFENKYGYLERFWFFRGYSESIEIQKEDPYFNNPLDEVTPFNYVTQNVTGRKSITLSTGFIHESANKVVEQLLLSEWIYVRLPEFNELGDPDQLPAIPDKNSLEYKTRLKDKLIQYDIDFKFAYDEI